VQTIFLFVNVALFSVQMGNLKDSAYMNPEAEALLEKLLLAQLI
jgi:hypothetical protein